MTKYYCTANGDAGHSSTARHEVRFYVEASTLKEAYNKALNEATEVLSCSQISMVVEEVLPLKRAGVI